MIFDRRMTGPRAGTRRGVAVAVIAVTTLLALGACAPATHPSASGTTSTHGAHPGGGSGSTPTPKIVAPPVSRVGTTCDQVAPIAQVNSVLGLTLVPSNGLFQVSDLTPYAFTEDGAIMCQYGQPDPTTDLGFYEVYVIPDVSASDWATYVGDDGADLAGFDITPSPFGANTYLDCTATYHDLDCDFAGRVGDSVVYIDDYTGTQPTESNAAAETHMMPLLSSAVNAVKGATVAEPAWTDPNATSVTIPESQAAVAVALSNALGFTVTSAIDGADEQPDPTQPESLVQYPLDFRSYVFDSPDFEIQADVLPKGSWAFSAIESATSSLPGYALLPGVGDNALGYTTAETNKPHAGVVEATKGDNLVSVEFDTMTTADIPNLVPDAQKAAEALLAQIG